MKSKHKKKLNTATVPSFEPEMSRVRQPSFQQLADALTMADDVLERAGIVYFIAGETLRSIIENGALIGSEIELGVTRNNLTEPGLRMLRVLVPEYSLAADSTGIKSVEFIENNIPIQLKVYEPGPLFENLDMLFFNYDSWRIPNPVKSYLNTENKKPEDSPNKVLIIKQ